MLRRSNKDNLRSRPEALSGFQLLQVRVEMQDASKLLNNMDNRV